MTRACSTLVESCEETGKGIDEENDYYQLFLLHIN